MRGYFGQTGSQLQWEGDYHTYKCFPSDGKIVACKQCGTNHIRHNGHMSFTWPTCDACDARNLKHITDLLDEIARENGVK